MAPTAENGNLKVCWGKPGNLIPLIFFSKLPLKEMARYILGILYIFCYLLFPMSMYGSPPSATSASSFFFSPPPASTPAAN